MEQDPNVLATLIEWIAEELIALVVGSAIGAIGAKWFFGRKSLEELRRLRREVDELKRERGKRAPSPLPTSTPVYRNTGSMDRPTEGPTQPAAPAPPDTGSKIGSSLPDSSPPDAFLSPRELIALVEGHTGIAADRMLQPHKGRRHHVRGAIRDVRDYLSRGVEVILDGNDGTMIAMWLDQGSQKETLETLRRGDTVSATGLLHHVGNHIGLEECVLDGIDSDGASRD